VLEADLPRTGDARVAVKAQGLRFAHAKIAGIVNHLTLAFSGKRSRGFAAAGFALSACHKLRELVRFFFRRHTVKACG